MFKKSTKKISEERKQAILSKIKPIIAGQLEISEERIIPAANVAEDLGADSLDATELVIALEEEFKIEIPDEDIEKIKTIEDIIVYLDQKETVP